MVSVVPDFMNVQADLRNTLFADMSLVPYFTDYQTVKLYYQIAQADLEIQCPLISQ